MDVQHDTQILLNTNKVPDQRVYNAPTSDEVAVIWTESTSSSQSSSLHITVSGQSNKSHRIMHYYGCYDPLQYPLLFPSGDCGWNQGLKKMSTGGRRQLASQQILLCHVLYTLPKTFYRRKPSVQLGATQVVQRKIGISLVGSTMLINCRTVLTTCC